MDGDGSNQKRLSANYLMDFTPSVLNDGRIIYTRWDYINRSPIPFQSLWITHPDGTQTAHFFGNYSEKPTLHGEPQPIPGTRKVVIDDHHIRPPRSGDRGVADAEGVEQAGTVAGIHVRPDGDDRLGHDLVDIYPVRGTVLSQHMLGDIRQ